MAAPTESQIRAEWEVKGRPQGIPYPDFRAQFLASGGAVLPTSKSGGGGGAGAADSSGGGQDFLAYLAEATGADVPYRTNDDGSVTAAAGDSSIDYYETESARIQKAIASPGTSDAKKAELKQAQASLDEQYLPVRTSDTQGKLRGAGSDAEALAQLQALEDLRSSGASGSTSASSGGGTETREGWGTRQKQVVDPNLTNGLPVYDPWDEERLRAEWEQDFKPKGVSLEEYRQMVKEANPDGNLRYTSPTAKNEGRGGSAKTFSAALDPLLTGGAGGSGNKTLAVRNAEITRDASLGYWDNVTSRALNDLGSKNKQTDEEAKKTLADLAESGRLTKQQTSAISNKLTQAAESSNAESSASTRRLTSAVNTANASNNAALSGYESGIKPYQNQIAGTTRQNVQFDPEGLSAQRASLARAQGIAGGSLDYTSQGAQAYADPADVQRALEGIGMLRANATTGGNDQRENLRIAREEFEHGGEKQEHIYDLALDQLEHGGDKQREVYDRYKDISHPEMTADERAILAASQRQYATLDKANRDATSRDLEARGVMSGAGQVATQQAAQQRLGEERTAGVLGAQAQAVQRALQGLQGMEGTANTLRTGDQNALNLAGRAATDLRTGNQNAEQLMQSAANALRAGDLAAAKAFTDAAQRQREQGFQEEYSRGIAADNASANNQSTRLGGAQLEGQQANSIRTANDAINTFNNEQQGITDRYNTSFQQSEYDRLSGLQQQTFNNRRQVSDTNVGNEFGLDSSTQSAIDTRFGRTNTAAQTGIGVAMGNFGIDSGIAGANREAQEASRGAYEREVGTRIDTAGRRTDLTRNTNKDVEDALFRL